MLLQFNAQPETVKEFERRLRVSDLVIKFLTVRIDETLKRLEKRKKDREKRAHRQGHRAPAARRQAATRRCPAADARREAAPACSKRGESHMAEQEVKTGQR